MPGGSYGGRSGSLLLCSCNVSVSSADESLLGKKISRTILSFKNTHTQNGGGWGEVEAMKGRLTKKLRMVDTVW